MTPSAADRIAALHYRIAVAHREKNYALRNQLCQEHDAIALRTLQRELVVAPAEVPA